MLFVCKMSVIVLYYHLAELLQVYKMMLGTWLPSIQKELNKCCKLLLFTAAAAREAGKAELSASLREGDEWVPCRSPSQGGCRRQRQGTRMVKTLLTALWVMLMAFWTLKSCIQIFPQGMSICPLPCFKKYRLNPVICSSCSGKQILCHFLLRPSYAMEAIQVLINRQVD